MTKNHMVPLDSPTSLNPLFLQLQQITQDILLWQNIAEGQRTSQVARVGPIDLQKGEMTFYPRSGNDFKFHGRSYLYSYAKRRTTIFKSTILYQTPLKLIIRLPPRVMVANIREAERLALSDRNIHYSHDDRSSPDLRQLFLNSKLLDLSPGGLAFKSSVNSVVRFVRGQRVWMKSPFGDEGTVEGEIRHITRVQGERHEDFLRVGVRFVAGRFEVVG